MDQNKWVSLVLGKVYENCTNIKEKILFYETYFKERNINQKPLISSQDIIIMKFGQKQLGEFSFG